MRIISRGARLALIFAVGIGIGLLLWSRAMDSVAPPALSSGTGRELAEQHCVACHALPEPDQLPKQTWPFVMRWMGRYFGYAPLSASFQQITVRSQVPQSPLVHPEVLSRIRSYYEHEAPRREIFSPERAAPQPLRGYAARPLLDGIGNGALVTLLHVDERRGHLYVGTAVDRKLRIFDRSLELRVEIDLPGDPVHIEPRDRGFRLTMAGNFLLNEHATRIVEYDFSDDEWNGLRRRTLALGLHRSTESHKADLDSDGRSDLVVVSNGHGFGAGYGKVSVLWASASYREHFEAAEVVFQTAHGPLLPGAFEEQVLLDRAGGFAAQVTDLDEDGLLDVLVLAGQGDQELIAYLGSGQRRFERRIVARRHASWGYTAFAATDLDGDGHLDLVIANGDNRKMKQPPPRAYHGVRVLLGDGKLGFREEFFYPMYGASRIAVADLDGDGDRDIAAIAAYPDWRARLPETFTVLENQGDLTFRPRTLGGRHWGRWLRIASGDLDDDGDIEIFLGNGNLSGAGIHPDLPPEWKRWQARIAGRPSVVVLDPEPARSPEG